MKAYLILLALCANYPEPSPQISDDELREANLVADYSTYCGYSVHAEIEYRQRGEMTWSQYFKVCEGE